MRLCVAGSTNTAEAGSGQRADVGETAGGVQLCNGERGQAGGGEGKDSGGRWRKGGRVKRSTVVAAAWRRGRSTHSLTAPTSCGCIERHSRREWQQRTQLPQWTAAGRQREGRRGEEEEQQRRTH